MEHLGMKMWFLNVHKILGYNSESLTIFFEYFLENLMQSNITG